MGIAKRDHIVEILKIKDVADKWENRFGRSWNEKDVDELYADFIPKQINILAEYSEVMPNVNAIVAELRSQGIKIGSTTGYSTDMMAVVIGESKKQGFLPDSIVCANEVPAGRPAPGWRFRARLTLELSDGSDIKIGDTIPDIEEGLTQACGA